MKNKIKEIISKISLDNLIDLSSDEIEEMSSKYIEKCGDLFPSVDLQKWRIEEFLSDYEQEKLESMGYFIVPVPPSLIPELEYGESELSQEEQDFLEDFKENYTYITTTQFHKTKWDTYWGEMEYVVCKSK